ncbi:MAG: BMP family ABC transporter substrate-binding protein [Chloroflexota bacterium]
MRNIMTALLVAVVAITAAAPALAQDTEGMVFGMVLVGPSTDRGWSQAHYEAGLYVEEQTGAEMLLFESLNPADAPETSLRDVVAEMVDSGAELIITTSDDFEVETTEVAEAFPDTTFIHISGDAVLNGTAPPNLGNVIGQMPWGQMIDGCAAALTTETGELGYLGPLITAETLHLATSTYLGAEYCWETYRGNDPADLEFVVTWIGFWFNIPGVTLDPTEEANTFFDNGADVVISAIDTTEALSVASQRAASGETAFALAYDFYDGCSAAPEICLGVPYYNWGPTYVDVLESVADGTWEQAWDWIGPDWNDINDPDTSMIGFARGDALSEENSALLDEFIAELAAFATDPETPEDTFMLWRGPLSLQDGTILAEEGELVPGVDVWLLEGLLEGMTGTSTN